MSELAASIKEFLSTPSARRATGVDIQAVRPLGISIHALREEGDRDRLAGEVHDSNFYPRPPRGGRLACTLIRIACLGISIHALREEGDTAGEAMPLHLQISIHALREEGDVRRRKDVHKRRNFYPRPPRGGRPGLSAVPVTLTCDFYPRPPRGGRRICTVLSEILV